MQQVSKFSVWILLFMGLPFFLQGITLGSSLPSQQKLQSYHWPVQVTWEGDGYRRTSNLGPIWESRQSHTESFTTLRPLWVHRKYPGDPYRDSSLSVLYPLFSHHKYHRHEHWNILSLIRSSNIETELRGRSDDALTQNINKHFEVFPFYFDHRNQNPELSYFGLFPFYGDIKHRLFHNRISWIAFPLYSEWERRDEVTTAWLWPFIRYRTGLHSNGFSIWPLFGHFSREGDYHQRYALWPFIYYHQNQLDQPVAHTRLGVLPFYARETREGYIREDFLWPFFGYTLNASQQYRETRLLWPIYIQGRGEDRYLNQLAPLYSVSRRSDRDSTWVLWPIFNYRNQEFSGINTRKFRILYFLYQDIEQTQAHPPHDFLGVKRHLWPLFSYWRNHEGVRQFQMLSPFEPIFPSNTEIRTAYSPIFSLYRYQELSPDHKDIEFLFSLIQFQRRPDHERLEIGPLFGYEFGKESARVELLRGLLGYERRDGYQYIRLFWFRINIGKHETDDTETES